MIPAMAMDANEHTRRTLRHKRMDQLTSLARELGLRSVSNLNKAALIEALISECDPDKLNDRLDHSWWYRNSGLVAKLGLFISVLSIVVAIFTFVIPYLRESELERRLSEIDTLRDTLQNAENSEMQLITRLSQGVGSLRIAVDWAEHLEVDSPEIKGLADSLQRLLADFERDFDSETLSESDDRRIRFARATYANAQSRYQDTISLVTSADLATEQEATEAQIDREVKANELRGEAQWGLGNAPAALRHYQRILSLRPDHLPAHLRAAACLNVLGRFVESMEHAQYAVSEYSRKADRDALPKDIVSLANSLNWQAVNSYYLGEIDSARSALAWSISILRECARETKSIASVRGLALVLANAAKLSAEDLDLEGARDYINEVVRLRRAICAEVNSVEYLDDLVDGLIRRSNILADLGQYEEATQDLDEALELCNKFSSELNLPRYVIRRAEVMANRGALKSNLGRQKDALGDFDEALLILDDLGRRADWYDSRDLVTQVLGNQAQVIAAMGGQGAWTLDEWEALIAETMERALNRLELAIRTRESLFDEGNRWNCGDALATAYMTRAKLHIIFGTKEAAIPDLDRAINVLTCVDQIVPNPSGKADLAMAYNRRGCVHLMIDRADLAIPDFENAIVVFDILLDDYGLERARSKRRMAERNKERARNSLDKSSVDVE